MIDSDNKDLEIYLDSEEHDFKQNKYNEKFNIHDNKNKHQINQIKNQGQSQGQNQGQNQNYSQNRTPYFMRIIEKRTSFSAIYVILPISIAAIFIYFNSNEIFLTNLLGLIYPFYWSIKAIDHELNSPDDEKQWFTYWSFYLISLSYDLLIGKYLLLIPFFYLFKFIFLCWMFLPNFEGAKIIHDNIIRKYIPKFEINIHFKNAYDSLNRKFDSLKQKYLGKEENKALIREKEKEKEKEKRKLEIKQKKEEILKKLEQIEKNQEKNKEKYYEEKNENQEKFLLDRDLLNEFEIDKHKKKSKSVFFGKKDYIRSDSLFTGMKKRNKSLSDLLDKKNKNIDKEKQIENKKEYYMENENKISRNFEYEILNKLKDINYPKSTKNSNTNTNHNINHNTYNNIPISITAPNLNFEEKEKEKNKNPEYERKKSEELIDFELEKICGRLNEHDSINKASNTNNLCDYLLEKRRYEEHIREKFANIPQSPLISNAENSSSANANANINNNKNIPILIKDEKKKFFEKNEQDIIIPFKENINPLKQDGKLNLNAFPKKKKQHNIR
jgi:receptor expression-enhancing protein 5/6